MLEDDAVERNKDILTQAPTDSFRYGEADYYQDCLNRKSDTCSTFTRDNYGFTATYTAGAQDELVFFSVPWEAGWSATVNGEEAIIEKVNVGFMAVRVPATQKAPSASTIPPRVKGRRLDYRGLPSFIRGLSYSDEKMGSKAS